jgi:hypothetical protein
MVNTVNLSQQSDRLEYHGGTTIERIRKQAGLIILHDWLLFDTVEEAEDYFHESCSLMEVTC